MKKKDINIESQGGHPEDFFQSILKTAKPLWLFQYARQEHYLATGNMTAFGENAITVHLSYEPDEHKIRVHATLADHVREKTDKLQNILAINSRQGL